MKGRRQVSRAIWCSVDPSARQTLSFRTGKDSADASGVLHGGVDTARHGGQERRWEWSASAAPGILAGRRILNRWPRDPGNRLHADSSGKLLLRSARFGLGHMTMHAHCSAFAQPNMIAVARKPTVPSDLWCAAKRSNSSYAPTASSGGG